MVDSVIHTCRSVNFRVTNVTQSFRMDKFKAFNYWRLKTLTRLLHILTDVKKCRLQSLNAPFFFLILFVHLRFNKTFVLKEMWLKESRITMKFFANQLHCEKKEEGGNWTVLIAHLPSFYVAPIRIHRLFAYTRRAITSIRNPSDFLSARNGTLSM